MTDFFDTDNTDIQWSVFELRMVHRQKCQLALTGTTQAKAEPGYKVRLFKKQTNKQNQAVMPLLFQNDATRISSTQGR